MKFLTLVFALLSMNAFASIDSSTDAEDLYAKKQTWADLQLDQTYILDNFIAMNLQQPYNCKVNKFVLQAGKRLPLVEIYNLDVKVSLFQFRVMHCGCPKSKSEMALIDPVTGKLNNPNRTGREVGLLLDECIVNVYVETKNLYDPSIFSR